MVGHGQASRTFASLVLQEASPDDCYAVTEGASDLVAVVGACSSPSSARMSGNLDAVDRACPALVRAAALTERRVETVMDAVQVRRGSATVPMTGSANERQLSVGREAVDG